MLRQLLIVDDIRSNRQILKNMLGDEYQVLEAAHGREAVAILNRDYKQISAVLLDLGMPVMDGFEVLSYMQQSAELSQIPVIVTTGQTDADSEERALLLGAKDYISKPYKSAIIKQRIRNTIKLRETAATVNALQRDRLTGLFSREAFFERVAELAAEHAPGYYIMSCFDVDSFKVINDQYGTRMGDEALRHIARAFEDGFTPYGGVCCRVMADNFAALYPVAALTQDELARIRKQASNVPGIVSALTFSIGRYLVDDLSLTPSAMYDRASLAMASIKGRYDSVVAVYDESMREYLLGEQRIVNEMGDALRARQFETWFQPQYNHTTGALIGAEALVRWRHPEQGLIPPGVFIPIFEKNGFIYELDQFVWEETCRYLRKWLDEGRGPLPVSVNVSRYDIFLPGFVEVLTGLLERYRLPAELLRLEITESAFAQSTQQIVKIVKRLIDYGFTIEIDDFGSGYSSLNTLKNVPAQVVKLDMRFLEDDNDSQRGGNILESIVRMAKWLGMSVIAEGVEEKEQADFLKSIGCSYVQGYLYAKPMTAADYEAHCRGIGKEERLLTIETVENLDNNAFWNPQSMDTLIFNSYVGAACICEYHRGKIEFLRVTDKYAEMLGGPGMTVDDVLKLDLSKHMHPEDFPASLASIDAGTYSKEEMVEELHIYDLPGCPHETCLRSTMRIIASAGDRCLLYCISENITAQRQAEKSERKVINQLQAVMDSVNCGITAVTVQDERVEYLLANDRYYELLGYTREQYRQEINGRAFTTVHPEDRARVTATIARVIATGTPTATEFRAVRRDGDVVYLRCSISMTRFEGVELPVQLTTYTDVTSEKQAAQELLDNLPDGAALYEFDGTTLTPIHLNKRYWELVERAPAELTKQSLLSAVHPEDRMVIQNEVTVAVKEERDAVCDIRILRGRDGYRPFHVVGRVTQKADGKYNIYASYTPISDEAMSIREMLPIALRAMMDTQTDFSFVKDRELRYVCCSRAVYEAAGLCRESEMIGKTDFDVLDRDSAEEFFASDRRVMESGESVVDCVTRFPSGDGAAHYCSTSKFPLRDSQGNVVGVYGVGRDITEARAIKSQLELLTNNIPGGIAVYEGKRDALDRIRLTYFSNGFCKMFGFTREEYEQRAEKNPLGLVFTEDLPAMMEQVRALVQSGRAMDCVYRAKTGGGSFIWVNLKAVLGEPHGDNMTVNAVLFDVTARQEALERLRMSEEESRLAIKHSGCIISRYTVADRTASVPPEVAERFSIPENVYDVPYGPVRDGVIAPESQTAYIGFYEEILRGGKSGSAVYKECLNDTWRWMRASYSTIFSDEGEPVYAVVSFFDVTEELEKETAYKKWQQSLDNRAAESYTLFRCNVSQKTSAATAEGALLTGHFQTGQFEFDKRTAAYAEECVAEADRDRFVNFLNAGALLTCYFQEKRILSLEYRERLPENGGVRWLRLTVDLLEAPHSAEVEAYLLFEDIDRAKREELATREQAETDSLTGALNRAAFASQADALLAAAKPSARHALIMLDIDGFKQVNDAFGHSVGDSALIDVANTLRSALRGSDLVGRLGGDEFVVLLADIPGDAAAAAKAKQLCALLRRSFSMEVEVSGSIGIAIAPRDGGDFMTLYKKADAALYYVKGSGKDNYAFYHEDMADEHLMLEREATGASQGKQGREKRRRMLIVDDSRIDHAMLSSLFAGEFIVEKAKDGKSALIGLRHYGSAISVVLLDLMMPGMDGFAVLERMQQNAELRNIPVIVVSGDEGRETSLRAIRAGATDFVTKPVDPDILRIRVQSAISKAENERLHAKNSLLEYQNAEIARYKTVLEHSGTAVVEHDWLDGSFRYDAAVSERIAGNFDERGLWHILLGDLVADTATVQSMQNLVHEIATDRHRTEGSVLARLKTPEGARRWFRMSVYKSCNPFGLAGKLYLAFQELGDERPDGQ